jgi:hypothetical protein
MNQDNAQPLRVSHGPLAGMPLLLQYIWIGMTIILTVTGLASIVDGVVVWADFIAQILQVYKSTLRDPLAQAINMLWPTGWPRVPKSFFDFAIVWSSFFSGLRLFWSREGRWLRDSRGRAKISWWTAFVLGPFVGSYYAIKFGHFLNSEADAIELEARLHESGKERLSELGIDALRKRREAVNYAREEVRAALLNLARYYLLIASAFVLLLFINFQVAVLGGAR